VFLLLLNMGRVLRITLWRKPGNSKVGWVNVTRMSQGKMWCSTPSTWELLGFCSREGNRFTPMIWWWMATDWPK
jgi:hypothetical protein